jgi:hypothetical protein
VPVVAWLALVVPAALLAGFLALAALVRRDGPPPDDPAVPRPSPTWGSFADTSFWGGWGRPGS